MYQIDNSSAAPIIPASTAPGIAGYFTDGNPVLGINATVLPAEFMNMLMMELLNVLGAAGVTPSKSTFTQLTTAVRTLVRASESVFAIDTGSANVYAAAYAPAVIGLVDGMVLRFKAKTLNTGASTFSPDGITAKPIVGIALVPLQGDEIAANGLCTVIWSATLDKWVLLSCTGGSLQIRSATQSRHATTAVQVQNNAFSYAADTGIANAYQAAYTPAVAALADGMMLEFEAKTANTGASTFAPNGLAAKPLIGGAHQALQAGEIVAGGKVEVMYHAGLASWVLLGCSGGALQVGTATQSQQAVTLAQAQAITQTATPFSYFMGQL